MSDTEFLKDAAKVLLIFFPLVYFIVKGGRLILRQRSGLTLLGFGFAVMLLGGILDFTDEFGRLNSVFLIGADAPLHEFLEDFLGMTGFVIFAAGIVMQINWVKRENMEKQAIIQKLEKQAKQLQRFDRLKSKFVQDVSHEIRNPLANIGATFDNLIEGIRGDVTEDQKKLLLIGGRNIKRLSRLLEDQAALSQIEAGKMTLRKEVRDLCELAQEAQESLLATFREKEVRFKQEKLINDSKISCDPDRIIQVFINLIGNGLKFSPPKTQITIRISGEDSAIRAEVEDQGSGMSQGDIKKLFNRFERVTKDKVEGTGLGLVICKEIIEMHQGKIWVESELGKGTRFIFTLSRS